MRILFIVMLIVTCAMHASAKDDADGVKITINTQNVHYQGLPMHIGIVITNNSKAKITIPTPYTPFGGSPATTAELISQDSKSVKSKLSPNAFNLMMINTTEGPQMLKKPTITINKNESITFTLDIVDIIGDLKVVPDEYEFKLSFWESKTKKIGESNTIKLIIKKKDESAVLMLNKLTADSGKNAKSHQDITIDDLHKRITKEQIQQLAFPMIIDEMYYASEVSKINIDKYRKISPKWLLPHIDLFKYEILVAQNKTAESSELYKSLVTQYPFMLNDLQNVKKGIGRIARIRTLRDKIRKIREQKSVTSPKKMPKPELY